MNSCRRKLPLGIATFSEIINEGHYYVDKTGFARQLIEEGKYYFLSRPRRFGKSLFLDTLRCLFEGRQELFKGLQIENDWDWSRCFPVVSISFADGPLANAAALDEKIREILIDNQQRLGIVCSHNSVSGQLAQLLHLAQQKYGERVVVLIDEYDKPILDHIADPATATAMREGLRNLYSTIKKADADIRFVFMAGVSKFSKVNLFSGLNNLRDITLSPDYSALCGYTAVDLDNVFAQELAGLDREQIRHWYNGYNWLGTAVYNPYDLLLLLRERAFRPWWFETGTPTFLIKLMADTGFFTPKLAHLRTGLDLISTFDVDGMTPEALLFQSGYLTIQQSEQLPSGNWRYTLGYPNHEVQISLNASLLSVYAWSASNSEAQRIKLEDLLLANDVAGLRELFQAFFAGTPDRSIPHQWFTNNSIADYEGYYASVFYSYFAALGYDCRVEDATQLGRIDLTVKLPQRIYLFEFKVVESQPNGAALAQLQTKAYADKYRALGLPIELIGVEFSRKTRTVVGFEHAAA